MSKHSPWNFLINSTVLPLQATPKLALNTRASTRAEKVVCIMATKKKNSALASAPSHHRVDCTCMAHDGYLIIIFSHLLFARCARNNMEVSSTERQPPLTPTVMSLCLRLKFLLLSAARRCCFLFPMQSFLFREKKKCSHRDAAFWRALSREARIKNAKGLSH